MKHIALLTGATGGLGRCFAEIHAARGGDLILVGRSEEKLAALKAELKSRHHIKAAYIAVDLSAPDAAERIYRDCVENGREIEYLINNAGFGGQGDFARERSMEQDMEMIAVNITAPTALCKLFLPDMIRRGSGRVLNVSSTAAAMPGPLQAVYYASKAYVTSWSNALWRELKGTGVTVTALMPGAMETGFAAAGGLSDTKLFSNAQPPEKVAEAGYRGMLAGRLNVTAGLVAWQRPMMGLAPLFPKKTMLDFVYGQQLAGSAKK